MNALMRVLRLGVPAALSLLAGCSTQTLFQSSFSPAAIGSPPSSAQAVGTGYVTGQPGRVVVAAAPPGAQRHLGAGLASGHRWQPGGRQSELPRRLLATAPPGHFTFSTALNIPSGTGLVSISFEPVFRGNPDQFIYFLHLDFGTDGMVRVDDNDSLKFGHFPRDTPFDLFVGIDTNTTPPKAHFSLIGPGASGTYDYNIPSTLAGSFDGVRIWMGFPWTGSFKATDLLVTRNLP